MRVKNKVSVFLISIIHSGSSSYTPPYPDAFPSNFESNFGEFPFNPAFDAHKISSVNNQLDFSKEFAGTGRDFPGNSLDIYEQKPHLYTPDPYEQPNQYAKPEPYKPEPEPYKPPAPAYHEPEPYHPPSSYHEPAYHEPEPYHPPSTYHEPAYHEPAYHEPEPYHPPEPAYHEPEPYHPPSTYHEPEPYHPPHSDYGAPPPSSDYGAPKPYKPKGPVMLKKRPYEPKEIKPVTITTHEAYTGFDCRTVPYPDRHYADAEAGCSVS